MEFFILATVGGDAGKQSLKRLKKVAIAKHPWGETEPLIFAATRVDLCLKSWSCRVHIHYHRVRNFHQYWVRKRVADPILGDWCFCAVRFEQVPFLNEGSQHTAQKIHLPCGDVEQLGQRHGVSSQFQPLRLVSHLFRDGTRVNLQVQGLAIDFHCYWDHRPARVDGGLIVLPMILFHLFPYGGQGKALGDPDKRAGPSPKDFASPLLERLPFSFDRRNQKRLWWLV